MADRSQRAEVREVAAEDTARTYAAFCALREGRPAMATSESFSDWVNHRQRPEGYRVVGAFLPGEPDAVAAAGFRVLHQLSKARFLYVDDLVTLPSHRSSGYAGMVFDWLVEEARRRGCEQLHLDSGYQRFDAHRFYLKRGMIMNAHHFSMNV
ncbi:MAG TPA: GNAT family N-acetyltransferase [Acidobacteriaceae bacterium]|nr:GNAT family N-acetyltransferase [Acidobacteriaceae bacterium]